MNRKVVGVGILMLAMIFSPASAHAVVRTPVSVFETMFEKLSLVEMFEYRIEANVDMRTPKYRYVPEKPTVANPYPFSKKVRSGTNTSRVTFKMNGMQSIMPEQSQMLFSVSSQQDKGTTSFSGEHRSIDRVDYFKLSSLVSPAGEDDMFGDVVGRWYKIDQNALEQELADTGYFEAFELLKEQSLSDESTEEDRATLKQIEEAWQILVKNRAFYIQTLRSEKVEGVATYQYLISVQKNNLLKALAEIHMKHEGYALTASEQKELRERVLAMTMPTLRVWIGKDDFLPYKAVLRAPMGTEKKALGYKRASYTVTLTLKNYHVPTEVSEPAGAVDLLEYFREKFQEFES